MKLPSRRLHPGHAIRHALVTACFGSARCGRLLLGAGLLSTPIVSAATLEIPIENLTVVEKPAGTVLAQPVLPGQIPGVITEFVTMVGPIHRTDAGEPGHEQVWLFIDGRGTLETGGQAFEVKNETIARAPLGWSWTITVPAGATLRALRISKTLSQDDKAELQTPDYAANNAAPYVKAFDDCKPYAEAIKSAKTTSRTLLPEKFVPRMAIGTVETSGPDQVGRHKHPMLEQLFLGLKTNDSTVTADDARTPFPAFSLLHIPLGSMHGTQVAAGKKLYYVWMDFFTTKEGQAWLKMHKPIQENAPAPVTPAGGGGAHL